MPVITPELMSTWLGVSPKAAGRGLHSQVSAALWDIAVHPGSKWEGRTQRSNSTHVLWFAIQPFRLDYEVDGRPRWSGTLQHGAANLLRAGEQARGIWHGSGQVLHVYLPHELLVDVAEQIGRPTFEPADPCSRVDAQLRALASIVMDRIGQRDPLVQLEIDTLGIMACAQLLRSSSTMQSVNERTGRLGAWQTKRAISFLMEHIESDIGLKDIAAHVGLSPYHFNRTFKRTVGVSPHRYLLLRRIERAKELLVQSTMTIGEVAARVGYDDPNQLARLFRQELHISPSGYRRRYRR